MAHYPGGEPYDVAAYTELLLRAVETVLTPLGITRPQIDEWIKQGIGITERRISQKVWLGPLFDFAEQRGRS